MIWVHSFDVPLLQLPNIYFFLNRLTIYHVCVFNFTYQELGTAYIRGVKKESYKNSWMWWYQVVLKIKKLLFRESDGYFWCLRTTSAKFLSLFNTMLSYTFHLNLKPHVMVLSEPPQLVCEKMTQKLYRITLEGKNINKNMPQFKFISHRRL